MQGRQEELLTAAPAVVWLVADAVRRFGAVRFRAHGGSMFPAIRSGDVLTIHRCAPADTRRGDIVVMHDGERLFAHRLIEIEGNGDGLQLVTRGDAHWRRDPPRAFVGRVVAIEREGRELAAPFDCGPLDRTRGLALGQWRRLRSLAAPGPRLRSGTRSSSAA